MKNLFMPLLALSAMSVATTHAQVTILVSDSFPSNFNNFSAQGGSPAAIDGFQWSSDPGVGGVSGRINAIGSANHQDKVFYDASGAGGITWATGQEYGTSISFLPGTVAAGNIFEVRSGFIRNVFSEWGGGGSHVFGQVRQDGSGNPFLRLFQYNTQVGSNSASFTLSNTLWYELETTMTLASATVGDLSVTLYSRGADGTAPRTLVESISASEVAIGNGGFNGAEFWAGFGGGNNTGSNISAFDNFSVTAIPEPSTYAALLGALALGLVVLRRRRK